LNTISLSGRTGRFGRQGIAVNFVSDENSWQAIQDLKNDLGRDIVKVATGDFDEMEKVSIEIENTSVDPVIERRRLF
jgi:superfamily II DNA/RNA helicase